MLGTDRTRSFQKNPITFPCRSSVLVSQPQKICHIGTTQISFWAIIWQVLRADTVTNYTACHRMDAFILIVRVRVMNSTSQSMLFKTNTNVLPSRTSFMA